MSTRFATLLAWLLAIVATLPGCSAFRQTSADVVVRTPGSRFLGPPQPAAPEARFDLQFAWLSEAAYGNTPAGLKEKAAASSAPGEPLGVGKPLGGVGPCPESQASLFAAGWKMWPDFPDDGLLQHIQK